MKDIILQKKLNCSASKAWSMWTDQSLLPLFFGEGNLIELKERGAYEIYFSMKAPEGERGSEKCKVINFVKDESLSFTWNAPPSIPEARNSGLFTKVTIRLTKEEQNTCMLDFEHSGWNHQGEHWEETHVYFKQAWPYVLNNLEKVINKTNVQ